MTHAQHAAIVADVQAILCQESRLLPDFPREYGDWNPAKEWEAETIEPIADVLDAGDLKPPGRARLGTGDPRPPRLVAWRRARRRALREALVNKRRVQYSREIVGHAALKLGWQRVVKTENKRLLRKGV